jgi:hypothetical protein
MITEPPTGRAKNALQEFETLYIGGAEPAVVRRALSAMSRQNQDLAKSRLGQIKTMRDCEGKFNDHEGSYRLGDGSVGNKHEVER